MLGRLPYGKDLIVAVEGFCADHAIQTAVFSVIGSVTSATLGSYDQNQQVYVTLKRKEPLEIVHCTGNVSLKDGKVAVHAHAMLADINGQTAAKLSGYNTSYQLIPFTAKGRAGLKKGSNVISIHTHQTWGGQYIDVGIVDLLNGEKPKEQAVELPDLADIDCGKLWSKEKVKSWYKTIGELKGCNYLPRTAGNSVEMWQAQTFDPETIDQEFGWASNAGYNSVRVFLQYVVWKSDREGFFKRFDEFLTIADKHGISVMPIFFDDCCFAMKLEPYLGKQDEPVWGLINSAWVPSPGYSMVQDPSTWPQLEEYVKDIVTRYKNDKRIVVWDAYNEPGPFFDTILSFPLTKTTCRWIRQVEPIQPVTVALFANPRSEMFMDWSDVISIHNYGGGGMKDFFEKAKKEYDRPVLCTEWLVHHSAGDFEHMLPLFAEYHVGWYNWGLVAGRTQCYLSWGSRKGDPMPDKWMCDVLWPNGRPYNPKDIELIRTFKFVDK